MDPAANSSFHIEREAKLKEEIYAMIDRMKAITELGSEIRMGTYGEKARKAFQMEFWFANKDGKPTKIFFNWPSITEGKSGGKR